MCLYPDVLLIRGLLGKANGDLYAKIFFFFLIFVKARTDTSHWTLWQINFALPSTPDFSIAFSQIKCHAFVISPLHAKYPTHRIV
jgi:hypothetical protein